MRHARSRSVVGVRLLSRSALVVSRRCGIALPLFHGKAFTPLPYRREIKVLVGEPISVPAPKVPRVHYIILHYIKPYMTLHDIERLRAPAAAVAAAAGATRIWMEREITPRRTPQDALGNAKTHVFNVLYSAFYA